MIIYEHFSQLRKGIHCNKHLQNSFNKYKEENFKFEIIEKLELSKDLSRLEKGRLMIEVESKYVKELNPEYNIDRIIETTGKIGHTLSKETIKKIVESNRKRIENKPLSPAALVRLDREIRRKEGKLFITDKRGEGKRGWKHSIETIDKIKERSNKEDNKIHIREIQKLAANKRIGMHHTYDTKVKMNNIKFGNREIEIYNKIDNSLLYTCKLSKEASDLTGIGRSNISNNLCGISNSAGDYIFKYKIL